MIFRAPLPFLEAIESREVRSILPTEFRTRLLREMPAAIRERSIFSAGVTKVEFLQGFDDAVRDLLGGSVDRATKRLELKRLLDDLGYKPTAEDKGTLLDLSSDRRLNLILDTNLAMAQGYGQHLQGQQEDVLDEWPAEELIRVRAAEKPRDWARIWADAIATLGARTSAIFFGDRLVALKGDPIWTEISDFGQPHAPFKFGSGMDKVPVTRDEAMAMGIIDRDTRIFPDQRRLNDGLQASAGARSDALRSAIEQWIADTPELAGRAGFDEEGVLRLAT